MLIRRLALLMLLLFSLEGCAFIPVKQQEMLINKLYRRIPYQVQGDYRVIDIFYASNREIEDRKGELYFTREMSQSLTYGTLKARIKPTIHIGTALPKKMKRKGLVGVQEVQKLDNDIFIKELSEAVQNSPHKSLLVLVYGFKDNFELTATKAAYFSYLLDVNTPVLLFDWPGDQSVAPWGYKKAESYAVRSGPYLGEALTKIIREVKPKKIWIESSSIGCQVVCGAFEWMYKHEDLADKEAEISHVALSAPDVGEDEFDNHFKEEMSALTDKMTTYVSSNDEALLMAEILDWEKKVGRKRRDPRRHSQYEEAKDMLYIKSLAPDKVAIVDVTSINKASYGHGYDLEAPEFYDDFYMRIFDVSPHNNRRLYLVDVEDGEDYWILRGDK